MRTELKIRVPVDVLKWLRKEAAHYGSSLNGEVVRALRKRMEQRERPAMPGKKPTHSRSDVKAAIAVMESLGKQ